MTDPWSDPDWFRDEREANPPDPYELERIRLRAENARLTRELAERGYRYVPDEGAADGLHMTVSENADAEYDLLKAWQAAGSPMLTASADHDPDATVEGVR